MKKADILYWKNKYEQEEDRYNTDVEQRLRKNFREKGHATKRDIEDIIKWKFQGKLLGRQRMNLKRIKSIDDWVTKRITALAFEMPEDKLKLKLLMAIDGVGISVASVILAFYDPENYGVLDFHVWHALFKYQKRMFTDRDCLKFFMELRELSKKFGLPCRDVEKALFKKDLDGA